MPDVDFLRQRRARSAAAADDVETGQERSVGDSHADQEERFRNSERARNAPLLRMTDQKSKQGTHHHPVSMEAGEATAGRRLHLRESGAETPQSKKGRPMEKIGPYNYAGKNRRRNSRRKKPQTF